ncbi:NTP transferase domain-containing protein [Moorena sp. SIOASIH]|uniref:NTP transferase domain-containing protein n=1 Tax=Moorena sp. SIOASIH TaxID=2607817 RepID=UPI0025DC8E9F|nr:NTP transferase domain-containing protein [Moorena sp. SIOASIH]
MAINSNNFRAIILAASYGRRMRPLTNHTHKALLQYGEKTVLQRIIDALLYAHIDCITIVTGYPKLRIKLEDIYLNYWHLSNQSSF